MVKKNELEEDDNFILLTWT